MPRREHRRPRAVAPIARRAAALAATLAMACTLAPPAAAAVDSTSTSTRPAGRTSLPSLPAPASRTPTASAAAAAASGTPAPDPLTLRSPLCAPATRAALGASQRRACERTGSPLSGAPTAHYAFDINWNPPVTNVAEIAARSFYGLLDMLWLALLFAVRGILTLLDWAFTLNPFALDAARGLDPALERAFGVVDAGFLSAVIATLGLWGIWNGLVRRRTPETLGGLAAAVAMLALALAVVHEPDRTAGLVARLANQAAMGLMAAPSHGAGAAPVATYAEAVDSLFDDVVRAPWCALQFRTQRFCDGAAERGAVDDTLAAARKAGLPAAQTPGGRVTRGELWLAFAPGSEPRTAAYEFYGGHDGGKVGALGVTIVNTGLGDRDGHNPDEVALQGAAGSLVRLPLLVVIVAGVLGALLVLGWLTLRLLDQAVTGFVLLLLTPFALLLVAFGESGRAAFARWGLALLGALVSKVVYAALLGVVVLAARLLAAGADAGDWLLAWLLQSAFWWSAFVKRRQLIGYLSVMPAFDGARPGRGLGALLAWRTLAGRRGPAGAPVAAARGGLLRTRVARSQAVRAAGREHLDARADQRAAQHDADADAVLHRDASLRDALETLTAGRATAGADPGTRTTPATADAPPAADPVAAASAEPTASHPIADRLRDAAPAVPGRPTWDGAPASSPNAAAPPPPTPARPPAAAPDRGATTRAANAAAEAIHAERAALAPRVATARAERARRDGAGGVDERERRRTRLDQLRRELDLPAHDAAHAWRIGLSPDALLAQRDHAPTAHAGHVRTIGEQLAADRAVLRALPSDPRTPPRPSVERDAAGRLDDRRLAELRREQRARLRHERNTRRFLYR
jgi:hypothetical protein